MNGYREKLAPSWWMVLALGLFAPASALIFLPLNLTLGIGVGLALWSSSVAVLWIFSPTISIDENYVRAGAAAIEHRYISDMEVFRKEEARAERGVRLDARAWLVIRGWVDPVIKITITDEQDPAPYWLISARNPDAFIAAWRATTT